jgi:hypothetical protein
VGIGPYGVALNRSINRDFKDIKSPGGETLPGGSKEDDDPK